MKTLRLMAIGAMLACAQPALAPAFADAKSEAFVEKNANSVLNVLNDSSIPDQARTAKFSQYMNEFAHMPTIARRVLGSHGRALSQADFDKYYKTFENYAMAVYEVQLVPFRGESIKVNGSTDIDARRSQVKTTIRNSETGKDTQVIWDVLAAQDGKSYRVRDVGLNINGSVLWLAQDQQAQFEVFLDRNNGDVNKLIGRINQMIADMEQRKKSGAGSTLGKS
jgi:phospholipid transport system substrate-binding protein